MSDRAAGCPSGVLWGRGARVEVRRVWGVGGVVLMAAGGMGPHAFTASCSFAMLSFARASGGARALDWAAGCPWEVPWGRGARVEVRRVWGVGGVVLMATGGMGPHAFTASCSFALLSSARASGGARASDRAAGCPWGVPWGRGARVEVRRVWGISGGLPLAAGVMGPHAFTALCFFALLSSARASGGTRASDRGAGCPWGVPWGRGARVEVRWVWGMGGVVPMAAGGMGPRAFSASCFLLWCLLQGPQVWQGLRIGLLVARGECHGAEVRVLR